MTSTPPDAAMRDDPAKVRALLATLSDRAGLDVMGVASADAISEAPARLAAFLAKDHHGTMQWLAERATERANPTALWPDVRSIIMVGQNYGPTDNPLAVLDQRDCGGVSVYARGRDYHDVIKGKLKTFAGLVRARLGGDVKVFVDTAPVMEKPLAAAAGIGWQGKHTNIVSREYGSWLFLGAIFSTLDLPEDTPEPDHCGACTACLDICPTDAFPAPYQLDARRCISYLTIEHKGPIPIEFRAAIGNRIYGCDDCLAVCPWNKFAQHAAEQKLAARAALTAPSLALLAQLDDAGFRQYFAGGPVKRTGRNRIIRNVMIAIGNSGSRDLLPPAIAALSDASPLVRGAAVWAVRRLVSPDEETSLRVRHLDDESDQTVRDEWTHPL